MKIIISIILKELLESFRDRKTIMASVVLPAIIFPLLIIIGQSFTSNYFTAQKNKTLKIGVVNAPKDLDVTDQNNLHGFVFDETITNIDTLKTFILEETIDASIIFEANFIEKVNHLQTADIDIYHKSTNFSVSNRIKDFLKTYTDSLEEKRFAELNINSQQIKPTQVNTIDITPSREFLGQTIGSIIPYLFILICFSSCMYPSIDLFTGEKERKTLETLLTTKVHRYKVLLGKLVTICIFGFLSVVLNFLGLFITLFYFGTDDMSKEIIPSLVSFIDISTLGLIFFMTIPLVIFFGGILSGISIRANNFKEAQSTISPMIILVLIPAMISMFPGIELNALLAWAPITNIALACKAILSGTIHMGHYIMTLFSLLLYALLALTFSKHRFSRESNIL